MTPRHVDLHGLTLDEAEAKVRALVADVQEEYLADYEVTLIDGGAGADELAAELARYRAELVELRERAMERWRAMAQRGGKSLN